MSAKLMQSISYEVDPQTYRLDYRALRQQVIKERPFLLVAGYSAHSRALDFEMLRAIADEVGAFLLVDMAHFSGLVAGKIFKGIYNPVPYADIITSTTHKTLRGPRGGLVLCKERFKDIIDRACPLVFGGPLEHVIAAKAVAFEEASRPEFATYCRQVVVNAQRLASKLMAAGIPVLTGGTDNHMVIFDVHTPLGLTGREAERLLYSAGITVNRNSIPFDQNGSWHASGIRIGSPALTTLGMQEPQMDLVADWIVEVLRAAVRHEDGTVGLPEEVRARVLHQVAQLLTHYSVYGGILDHI